MDRRSVITSAAMLGAAAISGCTGNGDNGEPDPEPESTEEPSTEDTEEPSNEDGESSQDESPAEAQFEFVEWNIPSEAEIDEAIEVGMVVENVGGQAGEYVAPLYERTPDSNWTRVSEVDFGTIQAGEEVEMVFEDVVYSYVNRYELRLGDFQQTSALQVVSAKLDWGAEYATPDGYRIEVERPDIEESYEYEDFSGSLSERTPDSGNVWAFVNVWVKNETGTTTFSPTTSDFSLRFENTQVDSSIVVTEDVVGRDQQYESGNLQPGVERSGWILYEVPDEVFGEDISIGYSQTTLDGDIIVNWRED